MKGIYGENMPVVIGKKHTYVVMDLDSISLGGVIVSLESYTKEVIDKFTEEMTKKIKNPAGNHIFKVDDACVKLLERDNIIFHRLVETTIEFLTARVHNTDEDERKKI